MDNTNSMQCNFSLKCHGMFPLFRIKNINKLVKIFKEKLFSMTGQILIELQKIPIASSNNTCTGEASIDDILGNCNSNLFLSKYFKLFFVNSETDILLPEEQDSIT